MSALRLHATRLALLRARRRLERSERGAALLRRKREQLVTELFRLARPADDARTRIAEAAREAYPALAEALATEGQSGLRAIGWPVRDYRLEVESGSVWGIAVARIVARPPVPRTLAARATAPSEAGAGAVAAAGAFERLTELLLEAAPQETMLRRLGAALAQTSRQVQTLERRIAPPLAREIGRVRQVLEEREREERIRLRGRRQPRGTARS